MPTLVLLMIVGGAAFGFWSAGRAAAERATELGRDACRRAGVQLLDQTVHLLGMKPCRLEDGWLGWERTFRFDYSRDGADRHSGRMVLRGQQMVSFTGPVESRPGG